MAIKISFLSFDVKCQNDNSLEIRDGNSPDSLLLASYCSEVIPPLILSSGDKMGVRLSSDVHSYFVATLTVQEESCNSTATFIDKDSKEPKSFKSPGYGIVPLARGIHCGAQFLVKTMADVVVRIKNLDIQPGPAPNKCDKDKLIIGTRSEGTIHHAEYIIKSKGAHTLYGRNKLGSVYEGNVFEAQQYEFCGSHKNIDIYLTGPVFLNLITSAEPTSNYTGVDKELFYQGPCDKKDYTTTYGRIMNYELIFDGECSALITAPEGHTISLYFIYFEASEDSDVEYLNIYGGNTTDSKLLYSTKDFHLSRYHFPNPVLSTGNHLLLRKVRGVTFFDAVYVSTNKGRGCGGYMFADQGVVTSPFYPETYKEAKSCEFELETPMGTRLRLKFAEFDLGHDCANNFVQLLNRGGKVLSTYCAERPNTFTADGNYVKIVSVSTASNRGIGWEAVFGSVV